MKKKDKKKITAFLIVGVLLFISQSLTGCVTPGKDFADMRVVSTITREGDDYSIQTTLASSTIEALGLDVNTEQIEAMYDKNIAQRNIEYKEIHGWFGQYLARYKDNGISFNSVGDLKSSFLNPGISGIADFGIECLYDKDGNRLKDLSVSPENLGLMVYTADISSSFSPNKFYAVTDIQLNPEDSNYGFVIHDGTSYKLVVLSTTARSCFIDENGEFKIRQDGEIITARVSMRELSKEGVEEYSDEWKSNTDTTINAIAKSAYSEMTDTAVLAESTISDGIERILDKTGMGIVNDIDDVRKSLTGEDSLAEEETRKATKSLLRYVINNKDKFPNAFNYMKNLWDNDKYKLPCDWELHHKNKNDKDQAHARCNVGNPGPDDMNYMVYQIDGKKPGFAGTCGYDKNDPSIKDDIQRLIMNDISDMWLNWYNLDSSDIDVWSGEVTSIIPVPSEIPRNSVFDNLTGFDWSTDTILNLSENPFNTESINQIRMFNSSTSEWVDVPEEYWSYDSGELTISEEFQDVNSEEIEVEYFTNAGNDATYLLHLTPSIIEDIADQLNIFGVNTAQDFLSQVEGWNITKWEEELNGIQQVSKVIKKVEPMFNTLKDDLETEIDHYISTLANDLKAYIQPLIPVEPVLELFTIKEPPSIFNVPLLDESLTGGVVCSLGDPGNWTIDKVACEYSSESLETNEVELQQVSGTNQYRLTLESFESVVSSVSEDPLDLFSLGDTLQMRFKAYASHDSTNETKTATSNVFFTSIQKNPLQKTLEQLETLKSTIDSVLDEIEAIRDIIDNTQNTVETLLPSEDQLGGGIFSKERHWAHIKVFDVNGNELTVMEPTVPFTLGKNDTYDLSWGIRVFEDEPYSVEITVDNETESSVVEFKDGLDTASTNAWNPLDWPDIWRKKDWDWAFW